MDASTFYLHKDCRTPAIALILVQVNSQWVSTLYALLEVVSWMRWISEATEFNSKYRSDSTRHKFNETEIIIRPVNAQIDPLVCERALWCIHVWNSSFLRMTCISAVTERKSYKSWHMWSWTGNASPACHPTSFSSSPIWPICTCRRCNPQLSHSRSLESFCAEVVLHWKFTVIWDCVMYVRLGGLLMHTFSRLDALRLKSHIFFGIVKMSRVPPNLEYLSPRNEYKMLRGHGP